MSRQHDPRRATFIDHGYRVAISITPSLICHGANPFQPNALASDFMAKGARCVHQLGQELQSVFLHVTKRCTVSPTLAILKQAVLPK